MKWRSRLRRWRLRRKIIFTFHWSEDDIQRDMAHGVFEIFLSKDLLRDVDDKLLCQLLGQAVEGEAAELLLRHPNVSAQA